MTAADIARRLGVSDRTVRRHLAARPAPDLIQSRPLPPEQEKPVKKARPLDPHRHRRPVGLQGPHRGRRPRPPRSWRPDPRRPVPVPAGLRPLTRRSTRDDYPEHPRAREDQGAHVVSLDAAREAAPPRPGRAGDGGPGGPPPPAPPVPADGPDDDASADVPVLEGEVVRVDRPGDDRGDWLADLADRARQRRPVVHPALRSRQEALATAQVAGRALPARQSPTTRPGSRSTAGKLAVRTPRGFTRLAGGLARWAFDLEGHPVRVATVIKADPEAYLKLSRQRDARVRLRVPITALAAIAALVGLVLVLAAPGRREARRAGRGGGRVRHPRRARRTGR